MDKLNDIATEVVNKLDGGKLSYAECTALADALCAMMGRLLVEAPELDDVPLDRLRELVKADKEGKIVTLPCKVGDTVYRIWEGVDVETEGGVLSCWEVEHIEIYADEILFVDNNDNTFTEKDIGKTVFLTKEEAEAALKEEGEDMGLTPKEVGRLFASVPHTCEYCVGCEVEPCEGSGCNSFLLSERRVVDRLCELVKADKEGRCVVQEKTCDTCAYGDEPKTEQPCCGCVDCCNWEAGE